MQLVVSPRDGLIIWILYIFRTDRLSEGLTESEGYVGPLTDRNIGFGKVCE